MFQADLHIAVANPEDFSEVGANPQRMPLYANKIRILGAKMYYKLR